MNYAQFRKQQKSFPSLEGTLKYIYKGEEKVLLLLHVLEGYGLGS